MLMNLAVSLSRLESVYLGSADVWDEFCRAIQAEQILKHWSELGFHCLVVVGGTGVGKSSWVNRIAGRSVTNVSPVRPCTAKPVFICASSMEQSIRRSLQSVTLEYWDFEIVVCDLPLPLNWFMVDCPDYDSLEKGHHALSRFLGRLSSAHLLITSPAKYGDELTLKAVQFAEHLNKPLKIMLNKWDVVPQEQQAEFHRAISDLFKEFLNVSAQSEKDIELVISAVEGWLSEIQQRNDLQSANLSECCGELRSHCQESYGIRRYALQKVSDLLSHDYDQFWERHHLVQLEIEKNLKHSLARIAEEKIFYFSKFLMKYLFSFVDALKSSGLQGSKSEDEPLDKFAREIRNNLKISLEQSHQKLREHYNELIWMANYPDFEVADKLKSFDEGFEKLKSEIFNQLSEKFSKSAGTKHSVMAVSQEVLLSLVFYSFLGPIGLLPGWEQALSGLCYMIYGKIPSTHLPTVIVELEQMSKECRQRFDDFLSDILEEPDRVLKCTNQSLENDFKDFQKSLDGIISEHSA